MMSKRTVLAGLALLALTGQAFSAEVKPYTQAGFEAAQKAGQSTLVEIHAPWCPVCKVQTPILSKLEASPDYKSLVVFNIDFDSQKEAVKHFGATMQSTLITFKEGKETGRSVGDTNPNSIAALLAKSI